MSGTLYGIGVGPGDPEDMTVKAVRLLKQCPVIAIPKKTRENCVSYEIALKAVPEIEEKVLVCVDVPMTKDGNLRAKRYEEGAGLIAGYLREGKDVALLTLGDATVYASDMYLLNEVKKMGFPAEVVNGIPSFCKAAASLQISLGERNEEIHILPGSYNIEEGLKLPGVKVLMKMGKNYGQVKEILGRGSYEVHMAQNCGMAGEKTYDSLEAMPDEAGYYSLMIVRNKV